MLFVPVLLSFVDLAAAMSVVYGLGISWKNFVDVTILLHNHVHC